MVALEINKNDVLFDSITTLSNFNLFGAFWNKYTRYALPKIETFIQLLKQDKEKILLMNPTEAMIQLQELKPIVLFLLKYKEDMKTINETEKEEFIEKGLELINQLETTVELLEDIAEPNHYFKLFCQNPSNEDWNDPRNDHWDNY
jgi:hypothetical protein